jgi:ABC-type Fe3+ transport system substrate-binding protein
VIQTSSDEFDPFKEGFEEAYPDISAEFVVLSGTATERFLLEEESGAAPNYDVGYPAPEAYNEITAMMGYDIQGMAAAGILDIPEETIDQDTNTVVSPGSSGIALAYNSDLISEDELPTSWEELGDPRFSRDELGMSMDVDLNNVAVLSVDPEWGVDRVVELSAAMAENDPIFADSHTSATLLVQSGEVAISPFVNLHSAYREVVKDPEGPLQVAFIEPVPVRQSEASGVMRNADNPCAALLYIEWLNSDPAQEILDADPLQASLSWPE